MKKVSLVIILLFVFSCSDIGNTLPEKTKLENSIMAKTAKQLKKAKKLIPIGYGASQLKGKEFLGLSFEYSSSLKIEEIRRLIVYSADLLLNNWITDKKYQKYLKNPYSVKNIEIEIYLINKDGSKVSFSEICVAALAREKISYKIKDGHHLKTIHQETYEEAKKIIKEEDLKK